MLRHALRAALLPVIKQLAPDGLVDATGTDGLEVYFEDSGNIGVDPRNQLTHWTGCTMVVVLYAVDDLETLAHHLCLSPKALAHTANGLVAEGAARFKSLKEGIVQGTTMAELRFAVDGTIKGVVSNG